MRHIEEILLSINELAYELKKINEARQNKVDLYFHSDSYPNILNVDEPEDKDEEDEWYKDDMIKRGRDLKDFNEKGIY